MLIIGSYGSVMQNLVLLSAKYRFFAKLPDYHCHSHCHSRTLTLSLSHSLSHSLPLSLSLSRRLAYDKYVNRRTYYNQSIKTEKNHSSLNPVDNKMSTFNFKTSSNRNLNL